MINTISFKNYKPFKVEQNMHIRPITILIGKNSAGKSAVSQLFSLLSNSLKGTDDEPLALNSGGLDFGLEFSDLLYGRLKTSALDLSLESETASLSISIASGVRLIDKAQIFKWILSSKNEEEKKVTFEGNQFKGFTPLETENTENNNWIDEEIKKMQFETDYVGPFGVVPKRSYNKPKTTKVDTVGIEGENAYDYLILDYLSGNGSFLQKVNNWYQKNFDGWGLRINADRSPYYSFEMTHGTALSINLKDVGEGMGQILPLVTRAYLPVKSDTIIAIEQPELHLHPAAHGNLAELFASTAKEDSKRKYIIETHSQNFVLRLRRLVAEQKLLPEDVIIYYVDFDEDTKSSSLKSISVDELGQVDYWPEGVFSETLNETIAIRTAQIDKENAD